MDYTMGRATWPPALMQGGAQLRIFGAWVRRKRLNVLLARGYVRPAVGDVVRLGDADITISKEVL